MAAAAAGDKSFLLYGANGYTGALTAEECARRGLRPILAGRREGPVRRIAERLGLSWRTFDLDSPENVARHIEDVDAVLLDAGPFSQTSAPVVGACLRTGTHYLDITGEIPVFEAVFAQDAEAKDAGCVLMPGVGFDVVPSDCLAAALKEALPEATRLLLAFHWVGGRSSRGTLKTGIEIGAQGGAVRKDGRILRVPLAYRTREIPFGDKPRIGMTIPWGDVSTAYYSTGIGDIEVYGVLPPRMIRAAKLGQHVLPGLLAAAPVKRFLERRIDANVHGPSEERRKRGRSELWGRAEAPSGRSVEGTLTTTEGYRLTVDTSVESVKRVLEGGVGPGAITPSMAFGASYITEFEGCEMRIGEPRP